MTSDSSTPNADPPGRTIADAIIALSAALSAAGLPRPTAILMPDRLALLRLENVIFEASRPWLTFDPNSRGQAAKVHGVELRSNQP